MVRSDFVRAALTALAGLLATPTAAALAQRPAAPPLAERLARAFDREAATGQRVATVVVHEGERVFAAARGTVGGDGANAKKAITTGHLFDLGSVTKSITAAAVLRLVETGKLALDAPLTDYFDELPASANGVTVRHLLGHTAGLPRACELSERALADRRAAAKEILAARADTPPGAVFDYSNAGYQLLAALVEQVTERRFEAFVEGELFRAAALRSATLVGGAAPAAAEATWRISGERQSAIAAFPAGFGRKGTTGVLMSADDVARWDAALLAGKVLRPESLALAEQAGLGGYGFGWFVTTGRAGPRLHHTGATEGYRAWLSRWPARKACVVVLGDERVDTRAIGVALEREVFPAPASDVGVQVASVDATDDGFVIEPKVAWVWNASDPGKSVHAFLPRERAGNAGAAVYCNVEREPCHELARRLRDALAKLPAGAERVHQVRVRATAQGLWAIARELEPFVDDVAADARSVRFGLRGADGVWRLEIQMDRATLERFVRALDAAL